MGERAWYVIFSSKNYIEYFRFVVTTFVCDMPIGIIIFIYHLKAEK